MMRIEDVSAGCLIIAVRIAEQVFCLECAHRGDGQGLTEQDVYSQQVRGVGVYCANCAHPFFVFRTDPHFIPILNRGMVQCGTPGCQHAASWSFLPAEVGAWLCDGCHQHYQQCDICPCCGQWYPAHLTQCPFCRYVFNPVVVVPGLCEYQYPQHYQA